MLRNTDDNCDGVIDDSSVTDSTVWYQDSDGDGYGNIANTQLSCQAPSGFVADGRIGHTHLGVPGHDGKFGFGGSCFPKDIQAMIDFAEMFGLNPSVLKGAWEKNLEVRPEQDWKNLKGRAVTDE